MTGKVTVLSFTVVSLHKIFVQRKHLPENTQKERVNIAAMCEIVAVA